MHMVLLVMARVTVCTENDGNYDYLIGMLQNEAKIRPSQKVVPQIFPSHVSGRGYGIGPVCESLCVCVCVCLSLQAEPLNVQTQNLVDGLTLTISRISLKVKVMGQRSFRQVDLGSFTLSYHITSCGVTS